MKKIVAIIAALITSVSLCAQEDNGQEFLTVVSSHEELDLSNIDLVTIPTHGPYIIANNRLIALTEDNDIQEMAFPEGMIIDDIIWTGADFIIKSGYELFALEKVSEPLMDFDIADYDIFPIDEKRIYVVSHQNDSSSLFLANLKVKRAKRLLTAQEKIVHVSRLGEATLVVTSRNIYMFEDKECVRYLSLWSPIQAAVMTDQGLLFATENEICLLIGVDRFALLFEAQVKKLLYDGQYLYILLSQGDLLRYKI